MRKHLYLKNVVTLELDSNKCNGCGLCAIVCPHSVFEIFEKKAEIIGRDFCIECGACVQNCPFEAIKVRSGVGCAAAIIIGKIKKREPSCDSCCDSTESCC